MGMTLGPVEAVESRSRHVYRCLFSLSFLSSSPRPFRVSFSSTQSFVQYEAHDRFLPGSLFAAVSGGSAIIGNRRPNDDEGIEEDKGVQRLELWRSRE